MADSNGNAPDLVAKTGFFTGLHSGMGLAAKGMVVVFVVFTALNVDFANGIYSAIRGWIETTLSWYYISAFCVMLAVCLYLMCSRFGNIRLGNDDSRPEFSNFSWFAMLFSAGVGIGLLFFSIAEPLFYFDNTAAWKYPNNPFADQAGATQLDDQRAVHAMRVTYCHWGFHAWAVYVMVGLCLAYFGFRKKLPLTLRSALYPVLREKIYGPIGHAVDLLAVFGTVFGVARPWCQSNGGRPERPLRGRRWHYDTDHFDRADFRRCDVSRSIGCRKRHPDYFRMEYLSQHRVGRVLPLCRPDRMADGLLRYDHRRLPLECGADGLLGRR